MKLSHPLVMSVLALALGIGFWSFGTSQAWSQAPAATARAVTSVAVIDMNHIFNNHVRFQQLKENMRREVESAEQELTAARASIEKMAERLQQYNKTSPEYAQLEQDIARQQADLNIKAASHRKRFVEMEAQIYYNVYREVIDHVRFYCEQNGIAVVLKINSPPTDPNDPQEIMRDMSKDVIYHHPGLDITQVILNGVNSTAAARPAGYPQTGDSRAAQPSQLPPR